jgi:hypothetical protein
MRAASCGRGWPTSSASTPSRRRVLDPHTTLG